VGRVIAVFAAGVLWATSAHADSDAAKRALALFEEGRVAAKAGDYATACERFTKSLELDASNPGVELGLGDCNEHLGHFQRALKFYESAATAFERIKDA